MIDMNGGEVANKHAMADVFADFYEHLYPISPIMLELANPRCRTSARSLSCEGSARRFEDSEE